MDEAVDEDRAEADPGEEDEVIDNGSPEVLRLHGGAAVLDHDDLSAEFLDEGQGLGQHIDPELALNRGLGSCSGCGRLLWGPQRLAKIDGTKRQ
ncbi:hypothetical protein SAY86_019139 [Trapa natans]|uniref:Uncharacterized protein n=1 Tax=Trapa natans TaxID=22666 RepID=A0AAN7R2E6_TRANT|nr:hypothetical protein SAY86_019139 [Trapa natans]